MIETFYAGAAIAIAATALAITRTNVVHGLLYLIVSLLAVAVMFFALGAPFVAALEVIVYAGAIMVLVVFVIMLLNVEQEEKRRIRMGFLVPVAVVLAGLLIGEVAFVLWSVDPNPTLQSSDIGLTSSIGAALFTSYLLPFEITSILLLMAIVGAMTLARRTDILSPEARVIPGAQVLALSDIDPRASHDVQTPITTDSSAEAAALLGLAGKRDQSKRD